MPRNKRIILVSAGVFFILAAISAVYISGNGKEGRFFGQKLEYITKFGDQHPQNNTVEEISRQQSQKPGSEQRLDETENDTGTKKPKTIKAKALYLTGSSAGDKAGLDRKIMLIKKTELNAVVLDIKDNGKVNYESNVQQVKQNSAYHRLYDVDEVIRKLHENNIYVIGRIVCFRDPVLAEKRADLAIKRPNGQLWRENGSIAWTNPYHKEVWKYNIDVAKEAADKGFDEIQFDYVRFPAARRNDVDFGQNPPPKADAICDFLKTAYRELHEKKGVIVSADVFGIICESPADTENIGQDLERIGKDIDYICPMVYPSHYANAVQNGSGQSINGILFSAPDLKPYDVVYQSLVKAKGRIAKVDGYNAKVRPYLQDFTASWLPKGYYRNYGAEQVRQQIKAVYDAGYDEWILWDAANTYTEMALKRE